MAVEQWDIFEIALPGPSGGNPFVDHSDTGETIHVLPGPAALHNPHAGVFADNFESVILWSSVLGREFGRRFQAALGGTAAQSYGKAALVGVNGEYEHGEGERESSMGTMAPLIERAFRTARFGELLRTPASTNPVVAATRPSERPPG